MMLVVHLFWSLLAGLATVAIGWAWGLSAVVMLLLAILAGNLALVASAALLLLVRKDGDPGRRGGREPGVHPGPSCPDRT